MRRLILALMLKGSAYMFCNNSKCLSDSSVPGTVLGTVGNTRKYRDELGEEYAL